MQNRGRVGSMLDYETAVKFKNNLSPYRYSGVANLLFFEIPEIPWSLVLVLPIVRLFFRVQTRLTESSLNLKEKLVITFTSVFKGYCMSTSLLHHSLLSRYLFVPFCLRLMASSSPAISSKVEDTADGNAAALASCIFCKIAASGGEKTNTNILYQDNDVVAFPDIKPAAKHHTLVISKQHVLNAKVLTSEHKALVQKMVDTGKKLMQEQGIELDDVRYGFHWPPFYSIGHLHLHVIAPVSEMSFLSKIIFKPNTWWFVTPDYVLSRL